MKYNISKKIIAGSLLFGTLLSPVLALAEAPSPKINAGKGICVQISDLSDKKIAAAEDKQTKFQTKYTEQLKQYEEKQIAADTKLQEKRDEAENALLAKISAFSETASTTEQKKAVSDFQTAIESARTARKTSLDSAIKAFRDGVASSSDSRKSTIDTALLTFQTSVTSAFEKAKTDCANSVSPQTIRANLKLALNGAQEKLKADKLSVSKVGATTSVLAKTRKQAVAKIVSDYKAAIRKAKADLRLVFPAQKK